MNADAKFDAPLGRHARVALDHGVLHFDGAAHGVDHAAEFDERAVAGALYDAAMMDRNRRVDEITPKRPEPRQRPILVRAREPAEADDVGGQDRCEFSALGHGLFSPDAIGMKGAAAAPPNRKAIQPSEGKFQAIFRVSASPRRVERSRPRMG